MFLLNSRLGLFTAATLRWLPFSRSYGVILPSSLTKVIPLVLGFSPRLPVSVCGTGTRSAPLAAFLASVNSATSILIFSPHHTPALIARTSLRHLPQCLDGLYHQPALPILLCHCISQTLTRWYWNLNQLSIAYDICPRLRSRLTLGGRTFPRKP